MSIPKNKKLYEEVKAEADTKYKKPSAYKSGWIVKEYKKRGGTYKGKKDEKEGLARWYKEEWADIGGKEYPVYRPTKRITKDTPLTASEIDPVQAKKQIKKKQTIKGEKNLPKFQKKIGGNNIMPPKRKATNQQEADLNTYIRLLQGRFRLKEGEDLPSPIIRTLTEYISGVSPNLDALEAMMGVPSGTIRQQSIEEMDREDAEKRKKAKKERETTKPLPKLDFGDNNDNQPPPPPPPSGQSLLVGGMDNVDFAAIGAALEQANQEAAQQQAQAQAPPSPRSVADDRIAGGACGKREC